jgi:UDP-MurNAc hydroxylase
MSISFRILGHACMLVESNGRRLLIDPWLIGSCYWRSWWHFPKAVDLTPDLFDVDAIYITHGHFDHFHYPSLRKFNRSVQIVIIQMMFQPVIVFDQSAADDRYWVVISRG